MPIPFTVDSVVESLTARKCQVENSEKNLQVLRAFKNPPLAAQLFLEVIGD